MLSDLARDCHYKIWCYIHNLSMMLVVLIVCLFAFCNCQGPGGDMKCVVNFDSPIYAFGEQSQKFINTSEIFFEMQDESTTFMQGSIVFNERLDEHALLQIVVLKEASGKFEVVFSYDICDLCNELGNEASDYHKYLKFMELPSECPIEPGSYKINGFTLEVDDLQLKSSQVGRYEVQVGLCVQTGESCQQDRDCKCTLKMDVVVEEVLA